jgi:hypothetical protein
MRRMSSARSHTAVNLQRVSGNRTYESPLLQPIASVWMCSTPSCSHTIRIRNADPAGEGWSALVVALGGTAAHGLLDAGLPRGQLCETGLLEFRDR